MFFTAKTCNTVSTEVLNLKNDLQLVSELQLIDRYKKAYSEACKEAIVLIFKDRGYTQLEIGQLLKYDT